MIANNAAAAIVFPIAATVAVNVRAALAAPLSLGNGRHWQGALAGCAVSAAQLPRTPHSAPPNRPPLPLIPPALCLCRITSTSMCWHMLSCWAPPPCLHPPLATRCVHVWCPPMKACSHIAAAAASIPLRASSESKSCAVSNALLCYADQPDGPGRWRVPQHGLRQVWRSNAGKPLLGSGLGQTVRGSVAIWALASTAGTMDYVQFGGPMHGKVWPWPPVHGTACIRPTPCFPPATFLLITTTPLVQLYMLVITSVILILHKSWHVSGHGRVSREAVARGRIPAS